VLGERGGRRGRCLGKRWRGGGLRGGRGGRMCSREGGGAEGGVVATAHVACVPRVGSALFNKPASYFSL
jgi:hypothetical protein